MSGCPARFWDQEQGSYVTKYETIPEISGNLFGEDKRKGEVWVGDLPTSRANAMPQKFNPHQSLKNTLRGGHRPREWGGGANCIRTRKLSDSKLFADTSLSLIRGSSGSLATGSAAGDKNPRKHPSNQTGFKRPPAKDPDKNERT